MLFGNVGDREMNRNRRILSDKAAHFRGRIALAQDFVFAGAENFERDAEQQNDYS